MGILKEFIAVFRQISISISQLSKAVEEHKASTDKATHAYQQKDQSPPQIRAELRLPEGIGNVISTKPHEPNCWQKANAFTSAATAFFTALAFVAAFWYACEAHQQTPKITESAAAAQKAADTAHDALLLANRPWIKVKHRIVSPLNFDFVGASGPAATMTVENTLENIGNGVALNVVSWEDVIPLEPNMSAMAARKRQNEWCNANKTFDPRRPTGLNGYVLFPHDPFVETQGMGPRISAVQKAVTEDSEWAKGFFKGNGPNPLIGKAQFAMVGCVAYRSALDKDGTRPDVTGFLYFLGEPQPSGGVLTWVTPRGTAKNLRLIKLPLGDFAY